MTNYLTFVLENRRFLAYGLLFTMTSSVGHTYFIGLFGAEIRAEFALSHGSFGSIYSLATLGSGLAVICLGRKTDDVGFLAEPRLRLKDGQARLPLGAIKGQRLTLELRRLMQPAQGIMDFDKLPRRFRAVAADLETGEEVVLGSGELALAVRASMSFPGAFPPVEVDGRVLVDGGIVNNIRSEERPVGNSVECRWSPDP